MATNIGKVDYTPALANAICEHIAGGGSIRKFCRPKDRPNKSSVFVWLANREDFREMYAAAKLVQADAYTDECIDIADGPGDPSKVRNQLNARYWAAERANPKKYQAKMALEHTGQVAMNVVVKRFTPAPDEPPGE